VPTYLIHSPYTGTCLGSFFKYFYFPLKHNQYVTDDLQSNRKCKPSSPQFSNPQTVNRLTYVFSHLRSLHFFADNLFWRLHVSLLFLLSIRTRILMVVVTVTADHTLLSRFRITSRMCACVQPSRTATRRCFLNGPCAKMKVLGDAAPRNVVEIGRRFRGAAFIIRAIALKRH
jgi:hypothetical protein